MFARWQQRVLQQIDAIITNIIRPTRPSKCSMAGMSVTNRQKISLPTSTALSVALETREVLKSGDQTGLKTRIMVSFSVSFSRSNVWTQSQGQSLASTSIRRPEFRSQPDKLLVSVSMLVSTVQSRCPIYKISYDNVMIILR